MKFYTEQEIRALPIEAVIDWLIESRMIAPKVVLDRALPEAFKERFEYEWEDIEKWISFDGEDGTLHVPCFDERDEKIYTQSIFTKEKNDRMPSKGFFNYGDAKLTQKPLGIVEVRVFGGKITRKKTELRFEHPTKEYDKTLVFFYCFNRKKYIQVDVKNKNHQETKTYAERLSTLKVALFRILQEEKRYLEKFDDFYFHVQVVDNGYKNRYRNGFEPYRVFLEEALEKGMKIKLAFSSITLREYVFILDYKKQLVEKIDSALAAIDAYEKKTGNREDVPLLDFSHVKDSDEAMLHGVLSPLAIELAAFKTPRDEREIADELKGYIGMDLETGELFPNVVEMERRMYLTDEPSNTFQEKDLQKAFWMKRRNEKSK